MSIHTQREKEVLRRRASSPARPTQRQQQPPCAREPCSGADPRGSSTRRRHPPLGQSASYHLGDTSLHYRAQWSSDSEDDSDCVNRVPLLGDHGVGKSSLAGIFAGIADKDDHLEGEETAKLNDACCLRNFKDLFEPSMNPMCFHIRELRVQKCHKSVRSPKKNLTCSVNRNIDAFVNVIGGCCVLGGVTKHGVNFGQMAARKRQIAANDNGVQSIRTRLL